MSPRPFVVVISGGTASGKTTIAQALAARLGDRALLVSHDRYYRDVADPLDHNYDEPGALDTALLVEHLRALREHQPVTLPIYHFPIHRRLPEVDVVSPRPVILIEGLFVLGDPAVRAQADLMVFVEAESDLRLARRLRRDVIERGWNIEQVLTRYMRDVREGYRRFIRPSRAYANVILDGEGPVEDSVIALLSRLPAD
ncbi:MAG: uridine kinase [Deltaproteobacteria bacterium]|nr:uridine kinase [Deltaproteobacteria bacterium]